MQLLKGDVDRFRGLALYVRDDLSAYRQGSYECGYCEVIVVRICSSSHNYFYVVDMAPQMIVPFSKMCLSNLFLIWCVGRRLFKELSRLEAG